MLASGVCNLSTQLDSPFRADEDWLGLAFGSAPVGVAKAPGMNECSTLAGNCIAFEVGTNG